MLLQAVIVARACGVGVEVLMHLLSLLILSFLLLSLLMGIPVIAAAAIATAIAAASDGTRSSDDTDDDAIAKAHHQLSETLLKFKSRFQVVRSHVQEGLGRQHSKSYRLFFQGCKILIVS